MNTTVAQNPSFAGVRVMVIDDSNTIRKSAEIFLKQVGCTVLLAENGFDALAKIIELEPHVIFCDVMMPQLDGYQTCALVRQNVRYGGIPFIMLTSKDNAFDRARGLLAGSSQYITKPFNRESLLAALHTHCPQPATPT